MRRSPAAALQRAVDEAQGAGQGIGVDLVDVEELQQLVAEGGEEFVRDYWTDKERAEVAGDPMERLAGRWAAKEAVMKALGIGVGEVDPIDIEVVTLGSPVPLQSTCTTKQRAEHGNEVSRGCLCQSRMSTDGQRRSRLHSGSR